MGTRILDETGELTLNMVRLPAGLASCHSLAANIAAYRLDERAPASPCREDPRGNIYARDDCAHQCVHARQASGRVGDICRALLSRGRVVVPLQPAGIQRGTLLYLPQLEIGANALGSV